MEWYWVILLVFGGFIVLLILGVPIAFCFMIVNMVGVYLFLGGLLGLKLLCISFFSSLSISGFLAMPLFILMGMVLSISGVGNIAVDVLDQWLGRLPGRLALLTIGAGTIFGALSGVDMASVAMFGKTLTPEMRRRGYAKSMSLGPILASGGLAVMIPPSAFAIVIGVVGQISIGGILIGIIIPGLLMAVLYAAYIIIRCWLQPSLAPAYEVPPAPLSERVMDTVRYVLPIGFIIFMVLGVIFLGITSPVEASATGALGCVLLTAAYRKLNWGVMKRSFLGTLRAIFMLLIIISGATAFAQMLAFSGASRGLVELATGLPLPPIVVIIGMMVVVLFMGTLMESVSIMMICLPIFMPIIHALGFDPVWFAVILLLNIEMGTRSPPFGLTLFAMKAVAPPNTTMADCYRAAMPFLYLNVIAMALLIAFPAISLWLPGLMF